MINIENTLSKIEEKKQLKKESLMASAYNLFIKKGINDTSISDIANDAGVAKGTFYLYFKDKYDLRDKLIAHKAGQLFADAHHALLDQKFNSFEDQIIAVADYIIDRLNADHGLLTFISKNLSWGIFKTAFENTLPDESLQFYDYIFEQMKKNSYVCSEPELMLFTIIELVGSTCYSCILYGQPVSIEEYLPYLHTVIRQILAGFLVQQPAQIETKNVS